MLDSINTYYNPDQNNAYTRIFATKSSSEIEQMRSQEKTELSIETGFVLLAHIESLFRTDFVMRLESGNKWKDQLTQYFKSIYRRDTRPYQYGLDMIFEAWKTYEPSLTKEMLDILNNLPQYFEYRNWIAHGRYWMFKESNYIKKYNYTQIKILYYNILNEFGNRFKKKNFGL